MLVMAGLGGGTVAEAQGAAQARTDARPLTLVAFGDSLTAGYGLPQIAAFPAVLEKTLKARGYNVVVANAGVSGDTASGGLDRLDWSVADGTQGAIVEFGANDMLRGVDPAVTEAALDAIVMKLKARGIAVMLAGMRASPNLGPEYQARFDNLFRRIADRHGLVLYPFFLDGVAARRDLNQPDGLHPTAEGVRAIVDRILPTVEAFIATVGSKG